MIEKIGNRSSESVMGFTFFLAITGALLVIFFGGSAIWGVWIPFCFFTIPTVHYLCREILQLRQRVTDLEKKRDESL